MTKPPASAKSQGLCEHCGLPSHSERFCCGGCETAFRIINESGLDGFYEEAEKSYQQVSSFREENYEAFDHPDFLESYTKKDGDLREAEFQVTGLHCSACIWLLEKLPQMSKHCTAARVNYGKSTIQIQWKDSPTALSEILIKLARLGYPAFPFRGTDSRSSREDWLRIGVTGALAMANMHLGLYFLGAWGEGMDAFHAQLFGFISALLSIPVITYGAKAFFLNAYHGLRFKQLHTDLLVVLALVVGFAYSLYETSRAGIDVYYDSISMVVFLLLLGRSLIRVTTNRLAEPLSWTAQKVDGEKRISLPLSSLKTGDQIELLETEVVPVDLSLEEREAWFDLSVVTGESLPVKILRGQEVPQGAILQSSRIIGKVQNESESSSYARLIQKLNEPVSTFASSLPEQIFSASIILTAVFTFVLLGADSIDRVVGVLIVACPCALALSKPLVLDALRRDLFKNGIALIRLDRVLSLPSKKRIVFDKTGTLTAGALRVQRLDYLKPLAIDREKFEALLFTISKQSKHPLSRALALYLSEKVIEEKEPLEVKEVPGRGLQVEWNRNLIEIRSDHSNAEMPTSLVRLNEEDVLRVYFEDQMRLEAKKSVEQLQSLGLQTTLLSGDRTASVNAFLENSSLQFDEVGTELSPQDKVERVTQSSIMIGDGLNDAEALRKAGFGIGISGSAESNLKAADAYLLKGELSRIPQLLGASESARRRVTSNYLISALYNIVTVSLVLSGSIGPILCAIFMPLSSVSVVLTSNLAKFVKEKKEVA